RLVEGSLHDGAGEREQALSSFREAVRLAEETVEERAEDMELRRELADCYERLADFHRSLGQTSQAGEWYGKSLAIWRGWKKYGVSSVYSVRREKQVAAALGR